MLSVRRLRIPYIISTLGVDLQLAWPTLPCKPAIEDTLTIDRLVCTTFGSFDRRIPAAALIMPTYHHHDHPCLVNGYLSARIPTKRCDIVDPQDQVKGFIRHCVQHLFGIAKADRLPSVMRSYIGACHSYLI